MPAEAGIQSIADFNNFKHLDSRFRGNGGVFPLTRQPLSGKEKTEFPDGDYIGRGRHLQEIEGLIEGELSFVGVIHDQRGGEGREFDELA